MQVEGVTEPEIYLVEEIMDFKQGKGYLVRWAGYPKEADWTWQRGSDFLGKEAKQMIKDYRNVKKVKEFHADWVLTDKDTQASSTKQPVKDVSENTRKGLLSPSNSHKTGKDKAKGATKGLPDGALL